MRERVGWTGVYVSFLSVCLSVCAAVCLSVQESIQSNFICPTDLHTHTHTDTPHTHMHTLTLSIFLVVLVRVCLCVCVCLRHTSQPDATPCRPACQPGGNSYPCHFHTLTQGGGLLSIAAHFSPSMVRHGMSPCTPGEGKLSYVASCKSFAEAILECLHIHTYTYTHAVGAYVFIKSKYFLLWCGVWLSAYRMYVCVGFKSMCKACPRGLRGLPGVPAHRLFFTGLYVCLSVCLPVCMRVWA